MVHIMSLTPAQERVLAFIRKHQEVHGAPPTLAEIALGLGFRSVNAAADHVRALQRKGALTVAAKQSRGIRLAETEAETDIEQGLPLIGRVAAGQPILALEHIDSYYQVDARLFARPADYLLRVRGDSMIDAGIFDGDLIAVARTEEARNGQIVVARLGDEVTVKRFRREGQQVWLLAENVHYAPITVDLDRQPLAIEGLCVGVIRRTLSS